MLRAKPAKPSSNDERGFLGSEFLLWLWWCAETRGGTFGASARDQVSVALHRVLEFRDEATGVTVVVRGDAPTRAPEAREALSRGMRLVRAGLIIGVADENVEVVLDGASFDLRAVKAPRPEGDDAAERDAAALASLFGLVDALDRTYAAFLDERAGDAFNQDVAPRLLAWARGAASRRPTPVRKRSDEEERVAG